MVDRNPNDDSYLNYINTPSSDRPAGSNSSERPQVDSARDVSQYHSSGNPYRDALNLGTYDTGANFWDAWTGKLEKQYNAAMVEFDAQMALWRQQFDATNAYNSPAAQVARMRAAGLNPELQGVDNAGNSSASPSSSAPSVGNTDSLDLGSVVSAATTIYSSFTSLVSLVSSTVKQSWEIEGIKQSVENAKETNRALNIENRTRLIEQVVDLSSTYWNEQLYNFFNPTSVDGKIAAAPTFSFSGYGYTDKEMVKEMDSILQSLIENNSPLLRQAVYDKRSGFTGARMEYNLLAGHPYSTGSDYAAQEAYRELAQLQLDYDKVATDFNTKLKKLTSPYFIANRQNEENKYYMDYFSSLDGTVAADADNARYKLAADVVAGIDSSLYSSSINSSNKLQTLLNEYETEVNRMFDSLQVKLSKKIQELPDNVALPLLFLMSGSREIQNQLNQRVDIVLKVLTGLKF